MLDLTRNLLDWFHKKAKELNIKRVALGISGGKDSTVTAGLGVEVFGPENVYGLSMPNGVQADIDDAKKVIDYLRINSSTLNIKTAFDSIGGEICGFENSDVAKTNLPARLRMAALYAYAQTRDALVLNTCNLSEDCVGYATLFGDSCGSLAPISHLTTEEVVAVGDDLGLPFELVHKTPVDGLQPLTDEQKLGFTYHELNEYIRKGIKGPHYLKMLAMYQQNKFKTEIIRIPYFDPQLPNYFEIGDNT